MIHAILTDQALSAILTLTLIAALADLAFGIVDAVKQKAFTLHAVAGFLTDHVLQRVIPILAVAFVASALSAALVGVQNAPTALAAAPAAAWATAWAGVVAYVLETLASLGVHINGIASPAKP